MKAFITGGAGFIGRRVVEKLVRRGYDVTALVHSQSSAAVIQALGALPVWGDVSARASMIHAMTGSDIVFHLAGRYKIGDPDREKTARTNIDGTRNVLELAFQLEIPRIIYTSTIAVYGNTLGLSPTETYSPPSGSFATEYDRSKYIARYEIALPLIDRGAPIIILMPGVTYGPGDPSLVGSMMRAYYRGWFPVIPGPELTLTYAHVDDIAEGHLLAAEHGQLGESYHLTGPALTLGEAVKLWSKIVGRRQPLFSIPAAVLTPLAPAVRVVEKLFPLPDLISSETISILEYTYTADSGKARRDLGWTVRDPVHGFIQTFEAIAAEIQPLPILITRPDRRQAGMLALGAGLGVLAAWLILSRSKRSR